MQARAKGVYEFGPFHLDAGERLLLKEGEPVALAPKAFDTLLLLVENGGRLVDKEELMSSVWPDSFVEENSLNRSIHILRKTLGELSGQVKYIETVPKCGYRFLPAVFEIEAADDDLILEKHVAAEIITEEEEEITDSTAVQVENSFELARPLDFHNHHSARLHRSTLMAAGVVTLVLVAAGSYLVTSGRIGRAAVPSRVKSIAVLPFKTLAPTAQNEYLGVGIADVLITSLSNLKELNVRSTRSVLQYTDSDVDPVTAGRTLKVDAVLEGSVQRIDDRIRVTVRLMSVQEETPLWGAKFDEPAASMLKVQDSIAERVATALSSSLGNKAGGELTKHYTQNVEAYQLYLKGRYFWNKRSEDNYLKAIETYRQAIDRDSNYALAYAGIADAYSLLAINASGQERRERYDKARAAALRSLEIDDALSEAHTSLGWIKRIYDWDWQGAEREFKRALELSPNSADAHQWYAMLLTTVGRKSEAIAEIKRAKELEPFLWAIDANAFPVLFEARDFDEALVWCRDAVELEPSNITLRRNLITLYVQEGRFDDAIAEIDRIPQTRDSVVLSALLARAYIGKGQIEKARAPLKYLQGHAVSNPGTLYHLATVYVDLGEKDKAMECLRRACDFRDDRLVLLKNDPRFDTLRSQPGYAQLLGRMGLTD